MSKLSASEQAALNSYEKGEWKKSKGAPGDLHRYKVYARTTMQKNKRINIRLSAQDLEGIQQRAFEEGMPYQTLIASVIHKYVAGGLTDRRG
jgi:predicted DNA binding CopG/RHH family protein